ncbi:glycosyltransferase family 2 protein [Malaciobacter mytili]|uniref:glycosyltransferase family 2 protein n=1 Tax=Malaciobacter mytili TaxID=603050 RepID=UPI003BAE68C3
MTLSIVTTLYKSSQYIDEFYTRISKEAQKITDDYEIIFVDDGSPDDSLQKAIVLCQKDIKVKVLELSRNFGHHKAIMTGLSYTQGEFVFLIDSDLEEEPELLEKFWKKLHKEESLDVVYGVQKSRKGRFFEKISGFLFYDLFNFFSDIKIEKNVSVIRLMKRKYLLNLLEHKEKELIFVGLCALTGYKQIGLFFKKGYRGESNYNLSKKINMAIDMITSFSVKPLRIVFSTGLLITFLSIFYIIFLVFNKFVHDYVYEGWTALMISIWLVTGLIMSSIGILGIYLSKIFLEVKDRPRTVVKNIFKEEK